jgi:hypothetical protein
MTAYWIGRLAPAGPHGTPDVLGNIERRRAHWGHLPARTTRPSVMTAVLPRQWRTRALAPTR